MSCDVELKVNFDTMQTFINAHKWQLQIKLNSPTLKLAANTALDKMLIFEEKNWISKKRNIAQAVIRHIQHKANLRTCKVRCPSVSLQNPVCEATIHCNNAELKGWDEHGIQLGAD